MNTKILFYNCFRSLLKSLSQSKKINRPKNISFFIFSGILYLLFLVNHYKKDNNGSERIKCP